MYPMFVSREDEAIIAPVRAESLRRGDVALYRRDPQDGGILVLHRVYRRDREGFYMVGDNQSLVEGPLRPDQMRGVLVAWVRKGKQRSVKNVGYRLVFGAWLLALPLRGSIHRIYGIMKKIRKRDR
jgi:hypothetical protein